MLTQNHKIWNFNANDSFYVFARNWKNNLKLEKIFKK